MHGWYRPHVLLILNGVKEMREVSLLQFCESKCFWEGGQWHLEEGEGVNESYAVERHLHQFPTVTYLIDDPVLIVIFVHHKEVAVTLTIVGDHGDRTCVILC